MVDGDPYQRYGGMYLEIREYTDRPTRRALVDVTRTSFLPFGIKATILFPDEEASGGSPSVLLCSIDGRVQVTADESVAEIGGMRLAEFGPFEQVTITPTIRGARRTKSVTIRHAADLFVHAAS